MKQPKPEILVSAVVFLALTAWIFFLYPGNDKYRAYVLVFILTLVVFSLARYFRVRNNSAGDGYPDLFEASPIPMWIIDAESKKFVLVNEAMVEKYGYTREEFYGMTTYQIRPEQEVQRLNEYLTKVQKGLQDTGVWIHMKKNGEQFYVQTRTNIFKYKGRDSIIVLADDITDIIEKEKEISRLSLVAKNTINGIIITGADKKIEWVNDAFTAMTGYKLAEAIGKYPTDLLHGSDTDKNEEAIMKKTVSEGVSYSGEILNYRKDGSKLWVQTTISPLMVNGKIEKHVAIFLNINQRKQQEEMIQRQNKKLKEIAFANAHLIRAPLSNILGLTQLLEENPRLIHDIAAHLKTSAKVLDNAITQMIKQTSDSEPH